ncbi:MAG: 3'-5' exonuclease, partial [Candidatus Binataceae bacterium]
RNRRSAADTIARLLAATRAHAGIAIWPTGEQALANVMRLMDMARRYEANTGAASMRGFVDQLEARAEREEAGEIPMVEEGTEGVRVMTVHRAKGLEFPVVILADMTCNETAQEARRFVEPERRLAALRLAGCAPRELLDRGEVELRRDEEEAVRVLYVAATRARDLLVVPAIGDERHDGWLGKLSPALYPAAQSQYTPIDRAPAGCPTFGADSVRKRPQNHNGSVRGVAPGLHRTAAGGDGYGVVWWDPAALKLDARETMGLRQSRLLQADEKGSMSERGRHEYEDWKARRAATLAAGATPALHLTIATELAAAGTHRELPEAAQVEVAEVLRAAGRPHGTRFGTLVHATLSRIALDASRDEIIAAATFNGRMLAASDDEIAASIAIVAVALQAPVMRRARAAVEVRRECALMVTLDDGVTVEGVADLAFVEGSGDAARWTVVDFKTDLEIAGRIDEYRTQVALYVRAVSRASGLPAHGIILRI